MPCPSTIYCISNTGVPLYNNTYEDTLTNYNGVQYYTGQTNGLFIYYSSGDTQWCLSDTLGGTCFLSGKSPCSTTCPDLCDELFTTGSCPTPTPTPTNNCNSLDFSALFDCDLPLTPTVTPTMTVTPTVTVTPTSSSICPPPFIDATIFSLSPTPTPTPTITPSPSVMVERDCTFSGAVTYDMINDDIICPFSYEFQDCFDKGIKYYTFDTLENPSSGEISQFDVFNATVNGKNKCIHYVGFNNQISGTDSITLLTGPYGLSSQGKCILCDIINTPTPTPTQTVTPTITLTPTVTRTSIPAITPSVTPTITLTPSPTSIPSIPCGGALVTNGQVGYYEIITDIGTGTGIGYVNCFAGDIPDRFQIYWNNTLVADSLFVGDYLNVNGTQRTNYVNGILGTTSYNKFIYVGSGGNAPNNNQWNTNGTINVAFNNNDIAPNTSTRASGSVGNQLNVSANYLSATDKSCDGDVQLFFNKTSAQPTGIKIIVMGGKSGSGGGTTGWSIKKLICPTPPPAISLSPANCKVQGGSIVRMPVVVSNTPVGYYVSMTVISQTNATVTYFGNNVTYTETNSGSTATIKLDLYNTFGGTLLATTTQTRSLPSNWSSLPNC